MTPEPNHVTRHDIIDGVVPLEKPFPTPDGPWSLPDALEKALFGTADAPTACFAVLDAGQIPNLAELLAGSGLKHKCLFTGQTYDELADHAPWLVELEPGRRFTYDLFTQSGAGWHLWGTSRFIMLRSEGSFQGLWKHLRSLTRITDTNGKTFYFRFWETDYFRALLLEGLPDDVAQVVPAPLVLEAVLPNKKGLEVIRVEELPLRAATDRLILSDKLRLAFSEVALSIYYDRLELRYCESGRMSHDLFDASLRSALMSGFRVPDVLEALLDWCADRHVNILTEPWAVRALDSCRTLEDVSRLGQLKRASRRFGMAPRTENGPP